jgi:CheY-like chemotaxis protein
MTVTLQGNERILFVDDEEMLANIGSILLESLGYKVTKKVAAPEALDTFRANPENFDLVITDQTMPDLTGVELSTELLRIRPDIPIILCTDCPGTWHTGVLLQTF